jgi:SagB-type dehydrogenase family enzyme
VDTGVNDISFQKVMAYHERSKHHPARYARSPGYLDWASEPDPFRSYEGTDRLLLPLAGDPESEYFSLYDRTGNTIQPISLQTLGSFLALSMGLSAWKSYDGTKWALRVNPSSGNLHPTEMYLVLPPLRENKNKGGVFHYNPYHHALEQRASVEPELWSRMRNHFGVEGFLAGLSSIFWREAWKYGERAFRYCNHDAGHAAACISFSANLQGWNVTSLNSLSDGDIEAMLGFRKTRWRKFEREHPDLLLYVYVHKSPGTILRPIPEEITGSFESLPFGGEPNPLSGKHVDWKVIDEVASATVKPRTSEGSFDYGDCEFLVREAPSKKAAEIIRQRRSGQAYDGRTSISKEAFFSMLDKTIPRNGCAPFNIMLGEINVHLLLFVHRVEGMVPGLYFLVRNIKALSEIKETCRHNFLWEKVTGTPDALPLYLLQPGDYRETASVICCRQEIAGDGVFSAGMIAKFRENIVEAPYRYRLLFWETGLIGQVLYLEAEAHGVRGTGIGCYFDDLVHELLGFHDDAYQSLYHFTVGGAVDDSRLTTLPPYYHLGHRSFSFTLERSSQ